MSTVVHVDIHGHRYSVRSDLDPQYVSQLAEFLDERMQSVARELSSADPTRIAVIAALNIADELYRARGRVGRRHRSAPGQDGRDRADRGRGPGRRPPTPGRQRVGPRPAPARPSATQTGSSSLGFVFLDDPEPRRTVEIASPVCPSPFAVFALCPLPFAWFFVLRFVPCLLTLARLGSSSLLCA